MPKVSKKKGKVIIECLESDAEFNSITQKLWDNKLKLQSGIFYTEEKYGSPIKYKVNINVFGSSPNLETFMEYDELNAILAVHTNFIKLQIRALLGVLEINKFL